MFIVLYTKETNGPELVHLVFNLRFFFFFFKKKKKNQDFSKAMKKCVKSFHFFLIFENIGRSVGLQAN